MIEIYLSCRMALGIWTPNAAWKWQRCHVAAAGGDDVDMKIGPKLMW